MSTSSHSERKKETALNQSRESPRPVLHSTSLMHVRLHRSDKQLKMAKLSCMPKLRSFLLPRGRSKSEGSPGSLGSKLNVSEEYKEAFRTESYVEMWTELQAKLIQRRNSSSTSSSTSSSSSSSSSSSTLPPGYILRPQPERETIEQLVERFNCHRLLIDYFESSSEACDLCELLLLSVQRTRSHYTKITRVINTGQGLEHFRGKVSAAMYRDLASYAKHVNPLSLVRPAQFQEVHDGNTFLLRELTRKKRSIRRRAKMNRILRKVGGCGLVVLHMTLVVSMLVIALHSLVGIVAAPAIVGCSSTCLLAKKGRRKRASAVPHGRLSVSLMERVCRQLDLAAKGTFILINDFDTMSRLATSLNNEVEHRKVLSTMCVRNNKNEELLRQVVRELCDHNACYLEQLDELEQHVYLCFHTINRSRRFIMQEMMIGEEEFGLEVKEGKGKDYDGDSREKG